MNDERTLLGGHSTNTFLTDYWQKRPLLIRGALPGFVSPVCPNELAGLACEAEVESRLVLERGGPRPWSVEYGPLEEQRFAQLPETHWTLLVQECNRYVPELAELRDRFSFIPHWRVDDVMASYAPAEGSVGPHTDQYDVFLIQALGSRRWQISTEAVAEHNHLPDIDLRIMRQFTPNQEWILHPGDMLYLPPGVAHYGVAMEDCITLSVGFRAPSHAELLSSFAEYRAAQLSPALRFADPHLSPPTHPGEISPGALSQIKHILQQALQDDASIARWFGEFITEPKTIVPQEDLIPLGEDEFLQAFAEQGRLQRPEQTRFAFIGSDLYVDGQHFPLAHELAFAAPLLCDQRSWHYASLKKKLQLSAFTSLLTTLYNHGYVHFP